MAALADCGNSLPPQDAGTGNPENPRRFRVLLKWKKAKEGFFHEQLADYAPVRSLAAALEVSVEATTVARLPAARVSTTCQQPEASGVTIQ